MSRITLPEFTEETQAPGFQYSYEIDQEPKAGEGIPRRAYSSKGPMLTNPPGITSLLDNIEHGMNINENKPFLGYRPTPTSPFVWETYRQVYNRMHAIGSALAAQNFPKDTNIGLFSINKPEWVIAEYGCYWSHLVTVPLYDTLGDDSIDYIINKCKIPLVFATDDKAKVLLNLASKIPTLKTIVVMNQYGKDLEAISSKTKIKLIQFKDLEAEGKKKLVPPLRCDLDTIATISFTSGTTGMPKGAMISHGNLLAFLTGCIHFREHKQIYEISEKDVYLSYLPLAHVLERVIQVALMYFGCTIGFYAGDTLKLMDDLQELKPTIFASVPRLFNRVYDRIMGTVKAAGGVKSYLFNYAFEAKKYWLKRGWVKHTFWDRLVFKSVAARLGGRVQMMITGAAPISPEVLDFLRICFSVKLHEGYGSTEGTGGACVTHCTDLESGTVGPPMPHVLCKLRDVPSMNYYSTDKPYPRGEICFKGASIFKGYYQEPEKTKEALSEDGWLYTGDVGYWDEKGRIKIIDRVKNIFKLAQGEYIAPEKIEIVYCKHEIIAQAFVYGDSLQSVLVCVLVPDEEPFLKWAKEQGFNGNFKALCADENVKKAVQKIIDAHGRDNGLKGFENAKAVHLESELFSVENGLFTPTFKLKRHEAKLKYKKEIETMYSSLN